MRIGIIGAGFTGLSAALELIQKGHQVTIFESSSLPGGLAAGFENKSWHWPLEQHYHHIFTNDDHILRMAKKIGHKIIINRPVTSTFYQNNFYQLDSPISLLRFCAIGLIDRLRTGLAIAYLKYIASWPPLERITAEKLIKKLMGEKSWEVIWKPLLYKKFGKFASVIAASWFWARIRKRTASLAYPEGGFLSLAKSLQRQIETMGGVFLFNIQVLEIIKNYQFTVTDSNNHQYKFDAVICTLPTPVFSKISQKLDLERSSSLEGIGAVNLILELSQHFLPNNIYWLNINNLDFPFLALVEHTNFVSKKNYNSHHILYVGNYCQVQSDLYQKKDSDLLKEFIPYLKKINPHFSPNWIYKSWVFRAPFAQPIITTNYSHKIPAIRTYVKGLYLANIQQVYPWDRGTNYAVELGQIVACYIQQDFN